MEQHSSKPGGVFFSYSHDSSEHKRHVLELATRLEESGFPVILDQREARTPPEGWPRWCSRQIEEAAAVIVAWTGRYGQLAAAARDGAEEGRGSAFDSAVIWQEIYDRRAENSKFLPIVLNHEDAEKDIPAPLRLSGNVFRMYEAGVFDKLVARLSEFVLPLKSGTSAPPVMFVSMQISELLTHYLQRNAVDVDDLPFDWDITTDDLTNFCAGATQTRSLTELKRLLLRAKGFAFDQKYADQDYTQNARGIGEFWRPEIRDIMRMLKADDFSGRRIVNVGIGNGIEAEGLFDKAKHFLGVDIAPKSLDAASRRIPQGRFVCADGEDLGEIRTGSQDIYVSFRAYQSSYFDVSKSLREAYRVVRPGGIVLISVANGYISDGALIPGMLIPRSTVVNRDRPYELVDKIRRKLSLLRFEEIGIRTGFAEIFIYGRRAR
jgi:SAM-dependent methyltransferase